MIRHSVVFLLGLLFGAGVCGAQACAGRDCAGTLAYEAFGSKVGAKVMIVYLHGSVSDGGPADYMYSPAKRFADSHAGVITVALLAPGYYDKNGKQSSGFDGGRRIRDDTSELLPALQALREQFQPRKIILLGHSNGAINMAGVLIKNPALASGAVLVSGAYDMDALAAVRRRSQNGIDVLRQIDRIGRNTRITLVHGDADSQIPIDQSIAFEKTAKRNGIAAKLVTVHGAGHSYQSLSGSADAALEVLVR